MAEVSIILPAYNVEEYIDECISSILSQTYKDFEVIIVNDGSDDLTLEKAMTWNEKDYRIKVINQENQGAGASRNVGLRAASGKYIVFVDPDDFCHHLLLEKLYKTINKFDSDIAICDYYELINNTELRKCMIDIKQNKKLSILEDKSILYKVNPQPWNKIFKKKLLNENQIIFPEKYRNEDLYVIYSSILISSSIVRIDEPLYYYRVLRKGSATQSFSKIFTDILNVLEQLINFYNTRYEFKRFYQELEIISIIYGGSWYFNSLQFCKRDHLSRIIQEYQSFFSKYFPKITQNIYLKEVKKKWNHKRKVAFYILLMPFGPYLVYFLYKVKETVKFFNLE